VDLDAQSAVALLAFGRPSGVEPGGKYRPLLQLDLMRRLSAALGRRLQHAAEAHDQLLRSGKRSGWLVFRLAYGGLVQTP